MLKYYIIMTCFILFAGGCHNRPTIIGHRGNSCYAPENTIAAVASCWEINADGTEIDVHLTKDNQIVVIHDDNTKRTGGENHLIAESNYDDIKHIDVGSFKSKYFKSETIPLLKDVIATVPPGKKLFIEVKCSKEIIPHLKQVIENSGKSGLEIISFDFDVLVESKKLMPEIPAYWLISSKKDKETGKYIPYEESNIAKVLEYNLDGLDLNYQSLTQQYVNKVHAAGLKLYVWTVDHQKDAQHMKDIGVDGITTNYPANFLMSLK